MLKLEKTCRCIADTPLLSQHVDESKAYEFHAGREYQVDVFTALGKPEYFKVYQNGESTDWVFLNKGEFTQWFEEIEQA